jgi:isoprenylcysteine carboxyl methyltransferase (ICMT) family protein YpbQ
MQQPDLFLIAATAALLFWGVVGIFLQKKLHLYQLFAGKKYALAIHLVIVGFAFIEFLLGMIVNYISGWRFSAIPAIGAPIVLFAVYIFASTVHELGFAAVTHSYVFKGHQPKKSKRWAQLKDPVAVSYGLGLFGFALVTGHYAYLLCMVLLVPAFLLLHFIEKA